MSEESNLRDIGALNERMWAEARSREKKLRDLEAKYQALSQQPAWNVIARMDAALLRLNINAAVKEVNEVYDEWQRSLTLFTPPATAKSAGDWTAKIPWPSAVPLDVRRFILRGIRQGGVPLSKRVQVKPVTLPFGGGFGVAVEFSKW